MLVTFPSLLTSPPPAACAELMAPDHGNLSLTNGLLHGSVATYACAPEFVLNSFWLATATCQHGRWTRVPPRCIRTSYLIIQDSSLIQGFDTVTTLELCV